MGRLDSRCQRVALTRPLPCTQGSGGGGTAPGRPAPTRPCVFPSVARATLLIEFQVLSHTFLSKYHGKKT